MSRRIAVISAVVMTLVVVSSACTSSKTASSGGGNLPGNCTAVNVASSPEKFDLLKDLAASFNKSKESKIGGSCTGIVVDKVSSGQAEQLLVNDWPDGQVGVPKPVIWSPAATAWGAVLNDARAQQGQPALAPTDAKPLMRTPLVFAMPRPMAQALGWPNTPIGMADLLALARDPSGWASKGHPEWGAFRLGKTNPHFSTSGLNATIAQYYAATGKTSGLSVEDLNRPEVEQFNRVEAAVVHYGDTTLTFLNNEFRADQRGLALSYVSAVMVEEKSVIDYNTGNPDGILDPGEKPRPLKVPLVAMHPKDGTLFSDSPLFILNAPWVTAKQRESAKAFESFVLQPENQRRALQFNFRPSNPSVAVGAPIDAAHGVDPSQPQTTLGVPDPTVLGRVIAKWDEQRKGARVLLVIDVSGSMGDEAGDQGDTKLELAKRAAQSALGQFKSDDLVGLRIFSTKVSPQPPTDYLDIVPVGPISQQREQLSSKISSLTPIVGTPLYTVAKASYDDMKNGFDPARINAVVLLTDGQNDDPHNSDLNALVNSLRSDSEGQTSTPVRLFTIGYGKDADLTTLRTMAEATNAAAYDARNPGTIETVFTNVVSNF